MSTPVRLTDEELDILFSLARPIAQEARQGFLAVVAETLVSDGQRGPGAVWRAARSAQSAFLLDVRRAAEAEGTPDTHKSEWACEPEASRYPWCYPWITCRR
jgi:hypothetical protein